MYAVLLKLQMHVPLMHRICSLIIASRMDIAPTGFLLPLYKLCVGDNAVTAVSRGQCSSASGRLCEMGGAGICEMLFGSFGSKSLVGRILAVSFHYGCGGWVGLVGLRSVVGRGVG